MNKKEFFLPKGTTGRRHDVFILHIQGLILIVVLILALMASIGILGRTAITELVNRTGLLDSGAQLYSVMSGDIYMEGTPATAEKGNNIYKTVMGIWSVFGYLAAFITLGATILMLVLMRKRINKILEDPSPLEEPVRVKKGAYVWLGFLLGAYGGHLFALKKKKAWIYLGLGIVGMWIPLFFLYTSGISFADAFLACFMDKDWDGYIELDYYPYWI